MQFKGSELFAILQNSLFRVSYLPYLKLQRLFAVIHLSHPCNRVSEKVYLFSVANQFTAIHPALCLVIGIATFLLLLWLQNTSIGFWLVGGLLTLIYAAVFGLLAYFISEHDPIWGWVIGLNEMFKIVEREDDIIANEEKVFDGFLRTINTEILGADLIDVGLILRALTVETPFVKIKVHLTKRFFILTERSFACNVFSCTF